MQDCWNIFDGATDQSGLEKGLNAIGVFPKSADVTKFILRFSETQTVTFEEFKEAFLPQHEFYRHQLLIRPQSQGNLIRKDDCFKAKTQIALRAAWHKLFVYNQKSVAAFSSLCKECFSAKKAFYVMDSNNCGKVTAKEI